MSLIPLFPRLLFATFIISLSACFTPQKVIQMETSEDQTTKWNYGREIVLIKKGDFEARIFFDEHTKKDLIFDVEVVNLGEQDVLLQPENIYLLMDDGSESRAYDPEQEIFGEQMAASKRDANNKNAAILIGAATVATVVAVAATNNDDDDDDLDLGGDTFVYVNTTLPPTTMEYRPPDVNFWKDYALRKTTLEKDYKVGGKVVFPRADMARTLTIVVPVGTEELRASFKQRVLQP